VPQPIDRVSHVVWCVRPEQFDDVVAFWTDSLGVRFEEGDIPVPGLRIKFCPESGVEVITPVSEEAPAPIREFLAAHGPGVYHVMYGVRDIDVVADKIVGTGTPVERRISYAGRAPWSERYAVLEERFFDDRLGLRVGLVEMQLHDEAG
jgi:4-hydroxyphenylpyruvate dioxygenase-like putative hemolysin